MNINQVTNKGGNKIALIRVEKNLKKILYDGIDLGYIFKSSFEQKATREHFKSEDGLTRSVDFSYDTRTIAIIDKPDRQTINFLTVDVKMGLFLQYYYQGMVGDKHREIFSLVKVTPQVKIDTPGAVRCFPYEATHIALNNPFIIRVKELQIINNNLDIGIKFCGRIIIPANAEFVITESEVL